MTKKDFILIANVIREADMGHAGDDLRKPLAEDMAGALATTNARFDKERFITACLEAPYHIDTLKHPRSKT